MYVLDAQWNKGDQYATTVVPVPNLFKPNQCEQKSSIYNYLAQVSLLCFFVQEEPSAGFLSLHRAMSLDRCLS